MPPESKTIDIAPAGANGVCGRCTKECCNCSVCVAQKGGARDMCNRCYEETRKECGAP